MTNHRPALVYDGDCGICQRVAGLVRRLDRQARLNVLPWQTPGLLEQAGLTAEQCAASIWFVYPDGRRYAAAAAANGVLRELGGLWRVLALPYAVPGIRQMEEAVYRWVARNRHRLPGASPACAVGQATDNRGQMTEHR